MSILWKGLLLIFETELQDLCISCKNFILYVMRMLKNDLYVLRIMLKIDLYV